MNQSPNEPAEGLSACPCRHCLLAAEADVWWMVVCEQCGNKRCPHGNDHRNQCTRSNEPGQPGSAYSGMRKVGDTRQTWTDES